MTVDAQASGFVADGFEPVLAAFEANFRYGLELGAAFSAVVNGAVVVDLWGGLADSDGREWHRDTLIPVFSGTKGLVAVCMVILLARGSIELNQSVAAYWPEFGAQGKRRVTVGEVVSHRSGVPGVITPVSLEDATDAAYMAKLIAAQPLQTEPGRWHCYHAMTFGWMCGELVRRVDGRTIGRFFAEEVARPLGLDLWIGLPGQLEPRVAVLSQRPTFDGTAGTDEPEGTISWSVWRNPPRYKLDSLAINTRAWHEAEIPSSNGIGAARALARLYGCLALDGQIDGVRICSPQWLAQSRAPLTVGFDPYLNMSMRFGIGFQLQTEDRPFGPSPDGFGHPGAGGSVHGAWPSLHTGFSYAPNQLGALGATDPRARRLLVALHACVSRL